MASVSITPALATAIYSYDLTLDECTGGCGTAPFGTVTVTQTDAQALTHTMSFNVDLSDGDFFVHTGAGASLLFDLDTNPAITISNLSTGFTAGQIASGGSIHAGATGYWQYSVICTACGSGGSHPQPGPLDFDITTASALTTEDIVTNGNGFYFAVDILGTTGNTGDVAANTESGGDTEVPEPASFVLFGTALFGLSLPLRRARRNRAAI